jgi:hypothetical protein
LPDIFTVKEHQRIGTYVVKKNGIEKVLGWIPTSLNNIENKYKNVCQSNVNLSDKEENRTETFFR